MGAYVALLGETDIRKSEGLRLRWQDIDFGGQKLTIGQSKSGHPRYIPLTGYALEWLRSLPRVLNCPYVFAEGGSRTPTGRKPRWILSPVRLPVPPLRHAAESGTLNPTTLRGRKRETSPTFPCPVGTGETSPLSPYGSSPPLPPVLDGHRG